MRYICNSLKFDSFLLQSTKCLSQIKFQRIKSQGKPQTVRKVHPMTAEEFHTKEVDQLSSTTNVQKKGQQKQAQKHIVLWLLLLCYCKGFWRLRKQKTKPALYFYISNFCECVCACTCHEAGHKGFSELQKTVINVLQEGVVREAADRKHSKQGVIAWRDTEKRKRAANVVCLSGKSKKKSRYEIFIWKKSLV